MIGNPTSVGHNPGFTSMLFCCTVPLLNSRWHWRLPAERSKRKVLVHCDYEYLNFKGAKLSKSRGAAVEVPYFLSRYKPDPLRFYLTAVAPETRDTEFAWEDFVERNNPAPSANEGNGLVATWGTQSVASRMLRFACKRFDGQVPQPGHPSSSSGQGLDDEDRELLEKAEAGFETVGELYNACKFRAAPSVPSPQLRSPQLRSGQAGQAGQAWARRWPWPARPMATHSLCSPRLRSPQLPSGQAGQAGQAHSLRSPRLRSPQLRSGQAGQAGQAWTAKRPGSRSRRTARQRRRRYKSRRACASWTTSKPSWR
jgi:hypothetical protein